MTVRVTWIAVAAVFAATVARADPAADRALEHLDRGVAAFRAGELALAHRELVTANELAPDRPNPYRWLAKTEVQLGDCRAALVHIEGFLSRVAVSDPRVGELLALRAECLPPGPAAAATPGAAPEPSPEPSVVRRWWFWTAIGVVAVTAAGVTYGVTRGGDARLPPITCGPAGCRP
jgi:hypothetical protein